MEVSEEDVYTITGYGFDWKRVGRRLLSDQKVRDIDNEGGSEGEKRERMLLDWKRTKSHGATYQALVKVLRDMQNNATADLVEELERKRRSQGTADRVEELERKRRPQDHIKPELGDNDHGSIFRATRYACDKWRAIGRELGFTIEEQDSIVREPGRNGDEDYYEAMLRRWLDWAPPNHNFPSYQNLVLALRAVGKERLANDLEAMYGVPQTAKATPLSAAVATSGASVEMVAGDIILNEQNLIGEGAQGSVYKALWKVKQKQVAVKKIGQLSNAAKREIETMKSARHMNIVTFYGVYEITPQRFCLVLELAETSLDRHLKNVTPSFESSLNWAEQVGQGMHYLHHGAPEAIIHGDLKSSNVLVYSGGTLLKIGDFGSSKFKEGQQSSQTRVTIEWTAPELFEEGKHSMESDVYAFGILLWEMVTHEVPYKGLTSVQVISRVNKDQRPNIPPSCNTILRGTMQQCWNGKPKNRPSFKTVLKLLEGTEDLREIGVSGTTRQDPSTSVPVSLDSEPSLPHLIERVAAVIPHQWEMVGLQLGLTLAELRVIGPRHPNLEEYQRAFGEIFDVWRRRGTHPYTWRTLIGVLRSASVGEVRLSEQLTSWITQ